MSREQILIDLSLALNSSKKKEKFTALENLTNSLNQDALVKTLFKSSKTDGSIINWDILFIRVHNAVLFLVDENSTNNRQISDKHLQIIHSALWQVAQKSFYQKHLLINPNLVASGVLAAFESNIRIKNLGFVYLNIFKKYVMSHRKNWCTLKEEYWIGIKNICKNQCYNPPQGIQSTFFLETLNEIIRFSSKNCQISHSFLDIFTFLKEVFTSNKKFGFDFEKILLHLTNTVCLQLAVEFRYKVCEFMENVFTYILGCHEKKYPDKNMLVYHFFMMTLSIHNPNGLWEKKTFYAYNVEVWKSQIRKIFFLCYDEIKFFLKSSNKLEIEDDLLNLFVNVSYLMQGCNFDNVFDNYDSNLIFDEPGPSKKRKCLSEVSVAALKTKQIKEDGDLSNLLAYLKSPDCGFWLKYLELLLLKYPFSLKNKYCELVEFLYELIYEKCNTENRKMAIRCLSCLLEVESLVVKEFQLDIQWLDDIWNKTSTELIRSLHTEIHSETHLLIRSLIGHSKLQDTEPLIHLYCSRALKPNLENFKTLSTICQYCILPEVLIDEKSFKSSQPHEKVKMQLLNWLLEGEEKFPCKDLAKVLIALILKKFEDDIVISPPKDDVLISEIDINNFCELITQNYLTVAFENLKFVKCENSVENAFEIRIESSVKKQLFHLLDFQHKTIINDLNNENFDLTDQLKASESGLWFVELLGHLLSYFECGSSECEDCAFLTELLKSVLFLCTTKGLNLIKVKFFDLTCFSKLFGANFHIQVQRKIREPEFINLDFLQYAFELFEDFLLKTEDSVDPDIKENLISISRFSQLIKNPNSVLHFQSLSKREKLIVNIGEMLGQYIALNGSSDSNCYQTVLALRIMKSLTSNEIFDTNSSFYLQLILRIVYIFTKYSGITISVLNDCLDLMEIIFRSKPTDFEVIITALQVLRDLTFLVKKSGVGNTCLKLKKIIQELRNLIVIKKDSGVKTVCKFIECLGDISKIDLEGDWKFLDNSSCTIFDEIITFLKHPYHEVRLTAARQVGLLFVNNKNSTESTVAWQKKMFKHLFEVLKSNSDTFFIREKGCVAEYYQSVISSVSLISWASVICFSSYWRKKALFYLIYLAFLKKFQSNEVEDILKLICRELKIENERKYILYHFPYLFHKWAKKRLQIQDFPFYLMGYKVFDDFLLSHFSVFITVFSKLGQLDVINILSSKLNKRVIHTLKDCHSELIAFILPALSENVDCETSKKAQKLKRLIDQEVGSKTSLQWLTESLESVIFNMVRNIHDPSYLLTLCEFTGNFKDDKSPVGYKTAQIIETLENLSTNEDRPLLGKIAVEMPSMIEKILLLLLEDFVNAVIYEEKVFAFYKYIFFVETLSKATRKGFTYRNINFFIIRDVVYTLASIMQKTEDENLTNMACECFRKLGDSYLEEFSFILGEFLPTITTALTIAVKRGNKKALEVLSFMICENYVKLEQNIKFLDVFPSENIFSEINKQIKRAQTYEKNLKNTIKHFVNSGRNKNSGCRIEGLKRLHETLSDNKIELKEMYEELRILRGFSEDCKDSLLHQLICLLVELTGDSNNSVRSEAAKCLGELGPSDLTTLVLRPENNFTIPKKNVPAIYRLLKSAICHLSDLLISDNFEVKKASSKALYAVLSIRQGKEIFQGTKETSGNMEYLTPFVSKTSDNLQLSIRKDLFLKKIGQYKFWRPSNHEKWIVNLLENLLQSLTDSSGVIDSFIELIRIHWQFAENIFPVCLDFVLSLKEKICNEIINKNISVFFEEYFNYKNESSTAVNKTSVRCILNVVDYIRMQRNREGFHLGFELNVNYLHISKAALHCSAYFTSIFYAELWFEEKRRNYDYYMDINMICESHPEEGFALAEILRKCHSEIGNLDGIHGCGYMHMLNSSSEIQHYEQIKNWSLSMLHHDVQLCQGNSSSEAGLLRSLERFGMFYTLNHLIRTHHETPELTAIQYKCAAKLLDWSQLDSTYKRKKYNFTPICFDKCYYFALKAFHNEDNATFQNEIYRARKCVFGELTHCSLESSKNLYLFLTELQCLNELEEFAEIYNKGSSNSEDLRDLFEKWDKRDDIKCSEFKLVESIFTNRTILIKETWEKAKDNEMKNCMQSMLCRIYYKLTVAARKEKKYEAAIQTLSCFSNITNVPEDIAGKMKVEKARILWERGDTEIGRFLLNHFLKKNEVTGNLRLKSLRIYGDWMAKTKSENSREIIENYYLQSIPPSADESPDRIHSFASIAALAYTMYEQFNEYLSSPLFEIKQNLISTQQDLASELRQELGWNQNREKRMAYQIAAKQSAIDENEIKNSKAERDSYLTLAIKYYLLSLKEGEKYNLVVFRVISLWLSNSNNPEVIQQLQTLLHQIPTYKFLCLLPQLVPRMPDVCLISDLIEKILQDHPHHTLPLLFALNNSYEDLKYNGADATVSNPRVVAASSIIKKFQNNEKLNRLIFEMRRLYNALIELANYNAPDRPRSGSPVTFPEHLQIRRITDLSSVSVPSVQIPYNKNCNYDKIIGVRKFEQTYYLVGGINLPKRISCIGSDGVARPLLVKGRDDLRQDAVMQQVFTIMNSLLYQNKETSKRKLVIRTYKVLPLSQRSGVIEWCENTQPLSLYLTGSDGKSGAHKKYYPEDISAFDCRCMVRKVFAQPRVTNEEKLKVFLETCKQLHPVFHYFFIENFIAAGIWFERRLAYIHSVATSSMIGYILGIGDRHVHNILIDNATAEVIHIDLGIAFEQGKTLPTPETVPFRLTRDIVDGMGSSGVEGDFRISCIKTMEVLRENQDTIITLLEVLLYDPLYTWTITPEKAYSIQNHTETSSATTEKSSPDLETNKMAERALIRLKQKLQGTEAGFGATTVEGQVRILINEARDPNNLCRLFHGWQAHL